MTKLFKTDVPFGMVPNSLLNDERISLKAKGLFAFMQSKPNGWNFSAKLIATQCKESIDAVSSGLHELEEFGYLKREKTVTNKGFSVAYHLTFDFKNPIQENPMRENPMRENPMIGKSLNNSNKDISNKELSKKEERENALAFFKNNFPSDYEVLMMHYKTRINDFVKFSEMFEATVEQEGLRFEHHVISGRFKKFARNWIDNQNRFDKKVIDINAELKTKQEKIIGFA